MPKVFIDAAKGLYQQSGSGLNINAQEEALTGASSTLSSLSGAFLLITSTDQAHTLTLPAGSLGDVLFIANEGGHDVTIVSNLSVDAAIAVGEAAILIYGASGWNHCAN